MRSLSFGLLFLLIPLLGGRVFAQTPEPRALPGFLNIVLTHADDWPEREADLVPVTRDGWELPEFRSFPSLGIEVPGDRDAEGRWTHPATAKFYEFLDYLVLNPRGARTARFALDCSEQETGQARETRRAYAERLLDAAGMPREIVWLAAQESGFRDSAKSPVGALGTWQFMPATAARFGLSDAESVDYGKQTPAAFRYLKSLYSDSTRLLLTRTLGDGRSPVTFAYIVPPTRDWGLALAAYNTGEGNIAKAMISADKDDARHGRSGRITFWDVYGSIHTETRDYVPAILAWTRIASDPARFGFKPTGSKCP